MRATRRFASVQAARGNSVAQIRALANLNGQVTEILALKIVHGEYAAEQTLPPEKELHEVSA